VTDDRTEAEQATAAAGLSRETADRLVRFVETLRRWQPRLNLVSPATLPVLWSRHVADSLQLLPLAPGARYWVDLGSGGGFPGHVIAAALAERDGMMQLVESDRRKAAFLREAVRVAELPARVLDTRIDEALPRLARPVEVVTARALAPLDTLLAWVQPLVDDGAVALFPKGQDVDRELTEASKSWRLSVRLVPSRTDAEGRIVVIDGLSRR
jgi:16S rRNA (guanine527-N7)-methyltransferase